MESNENRLHLWVLHLMFKGCIIVEIHSDLLKHYFKRKIDISTSPTSTNLPLNSLVQESYLGNRHVY